MNSELLYITRKLGYPSSFGTRAGLGDFLEQYPDGIYAENGGGAPVGWESAAVWFGGDSERAAARFERMMAERNELSRIFRTRVSGVLVLTFNYRLKSRMVTAIPIGGAQPAIDPTWLYFTMPEGGTVSLTKNGTPKEVTLEYSLDNGNTWTEWVETNNVRSLTLGKGKTMHVRNTSETSTGFSTGTSSYYNFGFTANAFAGGNTNSLLCKNPENASCSGFCYFGLFKDSSLITPPLLPFSNLGHNCYQEMFMNCDKLHIAPLLNAKNISAGCYEYMFYECISLTLPDDFTLPAETTYAYCYMRMFVGCSLLTLPSGFNLPTVQLANYCYAYIFSKCSNVSVIRTKMTDISATGCLTNWLLNVSSTGDIYCPAELTIPVGSSGIPSGWTRHDI